MSDATPLTLEDSELLRGYAEDGSQAAFAELVRRRIDLVYSVALRQTHGNRQLAQEATQAVFTDLARKAGSLSRRPVLAGWLYRSAQFAATDLVRAEVRRSARERIAHTMHIDLAPEHSPTDWEKVRPLLDRALGEMDSADRDAIVLRFFDQRPFLEIGDRLSLSENAARMRVARALDKLAARLTRRGISSTAAALGAALGAQITTAAPAGLAASIVSTALAPAASFWSAVTVGKLAFGLATATIVAGGGAMLTQQARINAELRRELAAVRPDASALASLRAENLQLAARIAEHETLQRDVADIASLERGVAEAREALARRRAASMSGSSFTESIQSQIDLLNKEASALVKSYKALSLQSKDISLSAADRAAAGEATQQTLASIRAKQSEIKALISANQGRLAQEGGRLVFRAVEPPAPEARNDGFTPVLKSSP